MDENARRDAIVAVTDGQDTSSRVRADQVEMMREKNPTTRIYALLVSLHGPDRDGGRQFLSTLAQSSGGGVFEAASLGALEEASKRIATELQARQ